MEPPPEDPRRPRATNSQTIAPATITSATISRIHGRGEAVDTVSEGVAVVSGVAVAGAVVADALGVSVLSLINI
ncbi:hypothetical protein NS220_00740 [Microbacterium testaceum]|uniref:Uncharacterized protein n=1 Tax=Microbacterium testaceum TaxID=2033 RepID=A0A147F1K8_MICTE|nr:hypothetical protein NS220_00740 [Microbacterium testaceum]